MLCVALAGCGASSGTDAGVVDDASLAGDGGIDAAAPDAGPPGDGGVPTAEEVAAWVDAYAAAHPGRAGDINALTPSQVASDPDAQRLLAVCGADQRPVFPRLAWEYGGSDHAWIAPEASALCYCVHTPVAPSTEHWAYDATADHVTADVYVLYPEENPCRDQAGADRVLGCIGDATNLEIFVDIASYHDGADAGLALSEASSEIQLLLEDGSRVLLYENL